MGGETSLETTVHIRQCLRGYKHVFSSMASQTEHMLKDDAAGHNEMICDRCM
jgi:hypothetical protein